MSSVSVLGQSDVPDYLLPTLGRDGLWGSAGGMALRESLKRGSVDGVMDLLKSMNAKGVAQTLREAGFAVEPTLIERGRAAVFASVQSDLSAALDLRGDGFDLSSARRSVVAGPVKENFAAKGALSGVTPGQPDVFPAEFRGDVEAASAVQRVMHASPISVALLGDVDPGKRSSLLLVAGQALKKRIQGFDFEGVAGKYQVPLTMAEVHDLHRDAAKAVAEESVLSGLGVWSAGEKVKDLDAWVSDSMQRLLHGSVSVESAKVIMNSIESGAVGRHASEIGSHEFSRLLAEQGLDVNAPSIEEQVEALRKSSPVEITHPERVRGQYFGIVLAIDHRAAVVKISRTDLIELPFAELAEGQSRPKLGDSVRFGYKTGLLSATVIERGAREVASR